MKYFLLLIIIFLSACHVDDNDSDEQHNVDRNVICLLSDNWESGNIIASFNLYQHIDNDGDDSDIYLSVTNLTNKTITVGFKLYVDGGFVYTNSLINISPSSTVNFGKISDSFVNISSNQIDVYQTTEISPTLLPSSNG